MGKLDHNIGGYTTKQAADIVGVSEARIRQLTLGDDGIGHKKMLGRLIITPDGITQARSRNKVLGRKRKAAASIDGIVPKTNGGKTK